MKSLSSLKFETSELLGRNQMKNVLGGHPCTVGTKDIQWGCNDGTEGFSSTICIEHEAAFRELISDFCA